MELLGSIMEEVFSLYLVAGLYLIISLYIYTYLRFGYYRIQICLYLYPYLEFSDSDAEISDLSRIRIITALSWIQMQIFRKDIRFLGLF